MTVNQPLIPARRLAVGDVINIMELPESALTYMDGATLDAAEHEYAVVIDDIAWEYADEGYPSDRVVVHTSHGSWATPPEHQFHWHASTVRLADRERPGGLFAWEVAS